MAFAQSLIHSLVTRSGENPVAEVEFIRTRAPGTVSSALQEPAHIIHVLAHGAAAPDEVGFWSEDEKTYVNLTELAERFAKDGEGIEASLLFADCCSSAQGRFVRAIRDCIEKPIAYVGAKRNVDWRESTTFASGLYGSYFRNRGVGRTPVERGLDADNNAITGYRAIVDGPCPFVATTLTPSRRARSALGS